MFSPTELQEILRQGAFLREATTQIDILQVSSKPVNGSPKVFWEPRLDDSGIRPYLKNEPFIDPTLRIFFIPGDTDASRALTANYVRISLDVLEELCTCFEISPLFIGGMLHPSRWAKLGQASFVHEEHERGPLTIECFGQFRTGLSTGPIYVWLSYAVKSGSSTYIIFGCPEHVKLDILRRAQENPSQVALAPFTIHACIASQDYHGWKFTLESLRGQLLHWENIRGTGIPLQSINQTPDATEKLYRLSRSFHIMLGDLNDFDERLTFFIELGAKCKSLTPPHFNLVDTAMENMLYTQSRNRICRRWAENYSARTTIMINLRFSIGAQVDSRTNLEIANLTSKIARDAQRDSSSMITIAAVTMVFLPGTFISVGSSTLVPLPPSLQGIRSGKGMMVRLPNMPAGHFLLSYITDTVPGCI
ncbi:MAG: hypothetical protein Q9209_002397 [Squamulea sp. 1 TL-2023]